MRYCLLFFSFLLFFLPGDSWAQNDLINALDKSHKLPLKWRIRIGLTSFKTSILYQNNHILVGSNGRSTNAFKDRYDGVYMLDPITGDKVFHFKSKTRGDSDVNGVAASQERIFFGDDQNRFFAYNWFGDLLWVNDLDGDVEHAPAIDDLNADGILDVVVGTESGDLRAFNGQTGEELWLFQAVNKPHFTYPESRAFIASPTLYDINADGIRDVLIGNRNGDFYALDGYSGEVLWEHRTTHPAGIHSSAFVKDHFIYVADSYGTLYVFNKKGRAIYTIPLATYSRGSLYSSPVLSEKNTLAIGESVSSRGGGLWLLPKYATHRFIDSARISATPIIADILGTGTAQICVLTESGELLLYQETGELVGRFELPSGGEATPFVSDIDQDGQLELLLALSDQFLYCFDLSSTGDVTWGSFRGNPYNTGVYQDYLEVDYPSYGTTPLTGITTRSHLNGFHYNNPYQRNASGDFLRYNITPKGIGNAEIGMTFGKLKAILGPMADYEDITINVGMKAKAVVWDEEPQYYILYPHWEMLVDKSQIKVLITDHPLYKTHEGIGPGQLISTVQDRWGDVTLTYHLKRPNEEKIRFKNQPKAFWFSHYGSPRKGIYGSEKMLNRTQRYTFDETIHYMGVR